MTPTGLYFGGVKMPTPITVSFTNNKLWSANTGRTAGGKMVGDIIGIKKTISITWQGLKPADVVKINNYISNANRSFFTLKILDETFVEKTYTVYASDTTYEILGWNENKRIVKNLAVDLVEQ